MTTVTVQVGFLNSAWTVSPAWENVSADVERVEIRRGKPVRGVTADSGAATIRLRNLIGDYDPEGERGRYGSAGYAVYTHPGKRVRVLYGSTIIYDGLIHGARHDLDAAPEVVTLQCYDRANLLRLRRQAYSAQMTTDAAAFVNALAANGIGADWRATIGSSATDVSLPTETTTVAARIERIATAAQAFWYVSRLGTITYRTRDYRYATIQATLHNDPQIAAWIVGTARLGYDAWLRQAGWTSGLDADYARARYDACGAIEHNASDIINVARVTRAGGAAQTASAQNDSITKYDIREFALSDIALPDDAAALSLAQWIVANYSQIIICPADVTIDEPARIAALATLDLGDAVEVQITPRTTHASPTPRYGGTRRARAVVASLTWTLDGGVHRLVVGLEPVGAFEPLRVGIDEISAARQVDW